MKLNLTLTQGRQLRAALAIALDTGEMINSETAQTVEILDQLDNTMRLQQIADRNMGRA
jgi:hypothetical protein